MKMRPAGKILLPILFVLMAFTAQSQDFINEDFLDNIENNAKPMWSENTPAFDLTAVPDKYKNESATVIGFRRSVTIDKKSRMGFLSRGERSLIFQENVRFRIKLNDKNAVKNFTTIFFRYSDKTDGFSARIVKQGGTVSNVSLNDAVAVEQSANIPEFFKSFFDQQSGSQRLYFKVAIPDLEAGDILEYVTVTKSKLDVAGSGYIEFTPQYELCAKNYPILFNQIVIETDNKSFFKSLSFNGAPDFKKEVAPESDFNRFVFTDKDRPIEKDVNFINVYKVSPLVKFQVIYANNDKIKGALIGQKGEIKSGFTKEELAKKAWEDYVQVADTRYGYGTVQYFVDQTWAELKKLGAKDWPEKEYIKNVYYKLRNIVVNRDTYLNDKTAAFIFGSLLFQRDIKSELIITISNSVVGLKDVLFDQEIRYVCKVNNDLYFNITDHSIPGELVESLVGSEAYIISEPTKKGEQEIKTFTLPNTTVNDNSSSFTMNASLTKDMNSIAVSRTSTYKGITKTRQISDALKYTTYMLDDYKNYGGTSPTDKMRSVEEEQYNKAVKALKDNFKEEKPEFVKSQLQNEFSQKVKCSGFTIGSDGRTLKTKDLVFTEDFELPSMIRKAGKKYLVNLSGLVGGQLQIKKDERVRQHDINIGYPRSLSWIIRFKIPDGYSADGLRELNVSVDNEAGAYSSTAEEKDGEVILKVSKMYKQANLPKEKWSEVLAFVDAAYKNSFKYILLKPKQ
ncbi:MAG TPA: hypothetical protein PLC48_00405 [Ferruginibacter sp.]|nr:hypothetical protein [Ferruginibacter sp.]